MTECRCNEVEHLIGAEANAYERFHLRELVRDHVEWRALYVCPVTGKLWLETSPHSELHGGGWVELDQVSREVARWIFDLPEDYFESGPGRVDAGR